MLTLGTVIDVGLMPRHCHCHCHCHGCDVAASTCAEVCTLIVVVTWRTQEQELYTTACMVFVHFLNRYCVQKGLFLPRYGIALPVKFGVLLWQQWPHIQCWRSLWAPCHIKSITTKRRFIIPVPPFHFVSFIFEETTAAAAAAAVFHSFNGKMK